MDIQTVFFDMDGVVIDSEMLHLQALGMTLEAKLRTALVTSSTSQTVQKVDKVLHFTHQFDLVITADDTSTHKPSPEPYLLALERTGSNKARTMIIEDSSYGIIAGKAAGCIVCGLTTSFDAAILKDAGADLTSDNYRELHLSLQ